MKPWNASENMPLKRSWLKALARKARGWLDRFLEEDENKGFSSSTQDSSTKRLTNFDDPVQPSNNRKNAEVSSWDALRQSGPPEHWLRLVAESAPVLLRSLEEGEVTGSRAEEIFENEKPEAETPAADLLASSEVPAPVAKERPGKVTDSAFMTAVSSMTSLRQALYRWLRPTAIAQEKKGGEAPKGSDEKHLKHAGVGTQIWPEPVVANAAKQVRAHQPAAIDSEPPTLPTKRAEARLSSWKNFVQQKVQARFPNGFTNRAISKENAQNKKEEAVSFQTEEKAEQAFDVQRSPAASHPARRSVSFERASVDGRLNPGVAQSQKRSRSLSTMSSNLASWVPLPKDAMLLRNQSAKNSELGTARGESPSVSWSVLQAVDPHSFDSVRWPDSEEIDPWPELPENPSLSEPDWRESLRSSDHLRALDLEQRGGS